MGAGAIAVGFQVRKKSRPSASVGSWLTTNRVDRRGPRAHPVAGATFSTLTASREIGAFTPAFESRIPRQSERSDRDGSNLTRIHSLLNAEVQITNHAVEWCVDGADRSLPVAPLQDQNDEKSPHSTRRCTCIDSPRAPDTRASHEGGPGVKAAAL
jgi:hypothetical protein